MKLWLVYAFLSLIAYAVVFLLIRKLSDLGVSPLVINTYGFAIYAIFSVGAGFALRNSFALNATQGWLLFVMGIAGAFAGFALTQSVALAPNPGYALSIININAVLVMIGAIVFFGQEFSWIRAVGVLFALVSVILLSI